MTEYQRQHMEHMKTMESQLAKIIQLLEELKEHGDKTILQEYIEGCAEAT